ncbi:MAG: hypothetical protein EX285_03515 [Thaumarchaeota archaeon]|nr:hypothetical protein [Nitrososphaerota archaeon]
MIDMITFWVVYGLLTITWWGFIVYWSFPVLDKLVSRWTNGDYPSLLSDKFRNPFMIKLGLMDVVDKYGNKNSYYDEHKARYMFQDDYDFLKSNNRWSAVITFWISLLGLLCNIVITLATMEYESKSLHLTTIEFSNFLVEHASTPVIIVLTLFFLDGVIRKFYKIGKKAKNLLEKLPEEEK